MTNFDFMMLNQLNRIGSQNILPDKFLDNLCPEKIYSKCVICGSYIDLINDVKWGGWICPDCLRDKEKEEEAHIDDYDIERENNAFYND